MTLRPLASLAPLLTLAAATAPLAAQAPAQIWARQFGSADWDSASCLVPDLSGGVLIAGTTGGDLAWDPLESTCRHASLSIL